MKVANKRTIQLTTSSKVDFFTIWMQLMSPFLKLSPTELDMLTALVRKRHFLVLETNSEKLADILLFTTDKRQELQKELGFKPTTFNNVLFKLKNKNIISRDNVIASKVIPTVDLNGGTYEFNFTINIDKNA